MKVIIIGHEPEKLRPMISGIDNIEVKFQTIPETEAAPLADLSTDYRLIILQLGLNWQLSLQNSARRLMQSNQSLIVVGSDEDPNIMRQALKAGARDYLTYQMPENEIRSAINNMLEQLRSARFREDHRSTTIISARGGADAVFITANLAHITSVLSKSTTLAADLDFQFSTLPLFLDLDIRRSVIEAFNSEEMLDSDTIAGYTTKHKSGLHVMGPYSDETILPGEITDAQLISLINVIRLSYQNAFYSVPRLVDPLTVATIKQSDNIVIVIQQTVAALAIAKKTIKLLHEIIEEHHSLHVVVNDYKASNKITETDIRNTLSIDNIHMLPEEKNLIAQCSDIGEPVYDLARSSNLSKSLIRLAEQLYGQEFESGRGLFKRAVSSLGRLVS